MAISISNITTSSFTVNWTSHGTTVSTYNIEVYVGTSATGTPIHNLRDISSGTRSYGISSKLSQNTTYTVKLFSRTAGGSNVDIEYAYPRTLSSTPPLPTPSIYTSVSGRQVTVYGYASSDTTYVDIFINGNYTSVASMSDTYYSYTFTGSYNTTYTVGAVAGKTNVESNMATTTATVGSMPVPPKPTNFRVSDKTPSTIYVVWDTTPTATGYSIQVHRESNNSLAFERYNFTTNYMNINSGLVSGESYKIKMYAINAGGSSAYVELSGILINHTRPPNWTDFPTMNSGSNMNLAATQWNNFCLRVKEFEVYKGVPQNNFTTVYTGNQIRALEINQTRNAIGAMTTAPTLIVAGNLATASHIKALATSLNNII